MFKIQTLEESFMKSEYIEKCKTFQQQKMEGKFARKKTNTMARQGRRQTQQREGSKSILTLDAFVVYGICTSYQPYTHPFRCCCMDLAFCAAHGKPALVQHKDPPSHPHDDLHMLKFPLSVSLPWSTHMISATYLMFSTMGGYPQPKPCIFTLGHIFGLNRPWGFPVWNALQLVEQTLGHVFTQLIREASSHNHPNGTCLLMSSLWSNCPFISMVQAHILNHVFSCVYHACDSLFEHTCRTKEPFFQLYPHMDFSLEAWMQQLVMPSRLRYQKRLGERGIHCSMF